MELQRQQQLRDAVMEELFLFPLRMLWKPSDLHIQNSGIILFFFEKPHTHTHLASPFISSNPSLNIIAGRANVTTSGKWDLTRAQTFTPFQCMCAYATVRVDAHTHTHTHTDDRRGRGSSGRSRLEPPADTGGGRVVSDRGAVNRTNHEERRHRGDGEVPEPGQRQRPAGGEALRGGGAGVRLPCLLLRVDSEWEGSALWALLHQVTSYLRNSWRKKRRRKRKTTTTPPVWQLASHCCLFLAWNGAKRVVRPAHRRLTSVPS